MIVFWSGNGWMLPFIAMVGAAAGAGFARTAGQLSGWPEGNVYRASLTALWLGAAVALFVFALTVGKPSREIRVDPGTKRRSTVQKRHTFWLLAGHWWALFALVFAFATWGNVDVEAMNQRSVSVTPAGKSNFSRADALISAVGASPGHGNSAEAKEAAEAMSQGLMKLLKLEQVSTYCLLTPRKCVFLVHVPGLRHYSSKSREALGENVFAMALHLTQEIHGELEDVVVGIRGLLVYDRAILGHPGPLAKAASFHSEPVQSGEDSRLALAAFFDDLAPRRPVVAAKTVVDARAEPASAALPAALATDPRPAVQPAVATSVATEAEPVPPPAPKAPPPALHGLRTWTDATGRTMRAEYVRSVTPDHQTVEFRREDRRLFTIPITRLSPADREFITNHPDQSK